MVSSPVSGYVLTGSQLLELVVAKLGKAKSLKIKQKLVLYDNKLENGSVELHRIRTACRASHDISVCMPACGNLCCITFIAPADTYPTSVPEGGPPRVVGDQLMADG